MPRSLRFATVLRRLALPGLLLATGMLAGCVTTAGPAPADSVRISRDGRRCVESKDQADLVIHTCTRSIQQGALSDQALALVLGRRGFAYMDKGALREAQQDFDASVSLAPAQVDGHIGRALVHMRERKPDAAIGDYDRAIAVKPNSALLLVMRSNAHQLNGEGDKARVDVDSALVLEPANAAALAARGTLRRIAGDLDGAVTDLDRALAVRADQRDALESRGHIRFLRGDFAAAAEDYQRSIDPRVPSIDRSLWLFVAEARVSDAAARERLSKLRAKPSPHDLNALLVAMLLGQMSAEQLLSVIKDTNPRIEREQECTALFFAAEFHLWRGEKEKAVVLFKRAIATGATQTATRAAAEAELKRIDEIPLPAKRPPAPRRGEQSI